MKNKINNTLLPIFLKLAVFLNLSFYVLGQETTTIDRGHELAKLLPDSDVVVVLKASKILNETLPQLLSANHRPLLTKITDEINKIKADNKGLDFRDVENIAIGLKIKPVPMEFLDWDDLDFIWTALFQSNSRIDSKVPILIAKRRGKYNQEKIRTDVLYLVYKEKPNDKNKSNKSDPNTKKSNLKTPYFAVATYNENTFMMGSPEHVKKTIGESQKVGVDILNLLSHKPTSVVTFGAYFPNGLSPYTDFGDSMSEELVDAVNSIRNVRGSLDTNEGSAFISVVVESSEAEHARFLHDLLIMGRLLSTTYFTKGLKESNAPEDNETATLRNKIDILRKIAKNVKISQTGKKVMLNIEASKSDTAIILSYLIEKIFFTKKEKGDVESKNTEK